MFCSSEPLLLSFLNLKSTHLTLNFEMASRVIDVLGKDGIGDLKKVHTNKFYYGGSRMNVEVNLVMHRNYEMALLNKEQHV